MRKMRYSAYGVALCAAMMALTIYSVDLPSDEERKKMKATQLDGPTTPVVPGQVDTSLSEQVEKVATGTSSVPYFPKHINLRAPTTEGSAASASEAVQDSEYQLVGLGIRTVSIFGIQVYVVGMYVAVPDIATLQEKLVRMIDPVATTLVPGEKDKLKELLLDPVRGEEVWDRIVKEAGIRTAFRIVPTRNTDFMHMRDGFVRGITAKSSHFASDLQDKGFQDEGFGRSMNDLKAIFGGGARKKLPYGETLLLARDAKGAFAAMYEDKEGGRMHMGELTDERVSRLLWLNYLAGKSVSSEELRKSVVDGCVELVSRPVGTVATQVV